MTIAVVLLAAGAGTRYEGPTHPLLAPWGADTVISAAVNHAVGSRVDELVVVVGSEGESVESEIRSALPRGVELTVATNQAWENGQTSSLRIGVEAARSAGHNAVVVGFANQPAIPPQEWNAVIEAGLTGESAVVVASVDGTARPPMWLAEPAWDDLPDSGDTVVAGLAKDFPQGVGTVALVEHAREVVTRADLLTDQDRTYVQECLGRPPRCSYTVAARRPDGRPTVIENPPFLDDGTPMPTQFWLLDPEFSRRIGTLEADGGVNAVEALLGLESLALVHERYREYRESLIAPNYKGPRPSGGVGGTRIGVKCLHTHYAWFLAGGDDPVGRWVHEQLGLANP